MQKYLTDESVLRASRILEAAVEWEYCDCGCPQQRSPKSKEDAELLKIAAFIRVELLSKFYFLT